MFSAENNGSAPRFVFYHFPRHTLLPVPSGLIPKISGNPEKIFMIPVPVPFQTATAEKESIQKTATVSCCRLPFFFHNAAFPGIPPESMKASTLFLFMHQDHIPGIRLLIIRQERQFGNF